MIDTIVLIIKENHGFDNYFGTFPGTNGMTKGLAHAPNPPTADPNHTHEGWLVRETNAARLQYLESDIPAYFQYAREYTLCDNYFTAVAGPSTPNHLMLITADSPVIDNPSTYRGKPQQTYDLPSLPDLLEKAGLTWRAYCTGYPFNLIAKLGTRNQKPQAQFAKDAAAGKLANVSWIYGPQGLDEHPVANVTTGMNWTVQQVQAVMNGPQWQSCAIFITWDDWGGWYDHVTPPLIEKWTDGTQFYPGGRVGCLAISPFAKRGYISKAQHTHVSLLKFCESVFKLPALNKRDAASDGMEDCFNTGAIPAVTTTKPATTKKSVGKKKARPKKKSTARKKKRK